MMTDRTAIMVANIGHKSAVFKKKIVNLHSERIQATTKSMQAVLESRTGHWTTRRCWCEQHAAAISTSAG